VNDEVIMAGNSAKLYSLNWVDARTKYFNMSCLKELCNVTFIFITRKKWLKFDLWLNALNIGYSDSLVRYFVTRNYIT